MKNLPRETTDFYRNKIILAPMVRVGTLPMRLLALDYGAEIVYTEELVDLKLSKTVRVVNNVLETVDFVDPSDGSVVFRTCEKERKQVVLQIGTADPERALAVAKMVENDVAAIDVNMGCPKQFSIKGGMGAALLSNPTKAKAILKMLTENLKIPVTCKIRILSHLNETIELVKELASTGISGIAIHARTTIERPQHEPHPDFIRKIAEAIDIPVIANGGSKDIENFKDILKFRDLCGVDSVMVARAAQWNVSIFRKAGVLPIDEIIKQYLKYCVDYDNTPSNTKYCVQNILRDQQETPRGRKFLECQTLEQICKIWDLAEYCHRKQLEYQQRGLYGRRVVVPGAIPDNSQTSVPLAKKLKTSNGIDVIEHNVAFLRSNYTNDTELPKSILHLHAGKYGKELPQYYTEQKDKLFRTVITFNNKNYTSTYWEKNKKFAEQGAALACIYSLGLVTEQSLIENGSILR